jgi:hypothetical protein
MVVTGELLKWLRIALAVVLAAGLTALAPASAAQAGRYGCAGGRWQPNGDGTVVFAQEYHLKKGPMGECDRVASVRKGVTFYIWCIYQNDYDNMWFYGRVAGTQTKGWAYAGAFVGVDPAKLRIPEDLGGYGDGRFDLEFCGD